MTQNKDFRKGAPRRPKSRRGVPGWIWGVLGAGGGLAVALVAMHLHDRSRAEPSAPKPKHEPLSMQDLPPPVEGPAGPYEYPNILKKNTVTTERPAEPRKDAPAPVQAPAAAPDARLGTAVLQIASYRTEKEADAQRARLALLGLDAKIQPAKVNDQQWYRVRIGPFKSAEDLNRTRARLHGAGIDATQTRAVD